MTTHPKTCRRDAGTEWSEASRGEAAVGRAKAGGTGGKVSYHEKLKSYQKSTTCVAIPGKTGPTPSRAQPSPSRLAQMDLALPY